MVDEAPVYRFSDLMLDPANRRLTRGGAEIYLPPKTFDTFVVLVERHGRLVTRQALLEAVWTDTAVTDNALTQRISELREALGDDAHQPRFIRTLPRVGFMFIAPVEETRPADVPEQAPSRTGRGVSSDDESSRAVVVEGLRDVRQRFRGGRQLALVLLAFTLAAGSAAWWSGRPGTSISGLELVSTSPGLHRSPSLSPDSRMVAFISDASGGPQVWVRNLAGGDPIQVTFHDHPAARPRWSAQGDQIVYSVQGNGIWSVAPLGGKPRQLVDVGWNPDLSRDGGRLVFERRWEIWTANADGTSQRRLPTLRLGYIAHYGDTWPTFSPDGKKIAVFLGEKGPYGDYWTVPMESGEPQRLTFDVSEGGAPAWTPDGKYLVISSSRAGSVTLWRVPIAGGTPVALTAGAGDDLDPVVSPDGERMLFTNVKRTWSLVRHDTHTAARKTLLETRTSLVCPRFSWNGRRIAFFGNSTTGDAHLFVLDADGSNLTPVTTAKGEMNVMPHWAADDSALFYYQVRPSVTFRRIAMVGGASEEIARWRWDREHEAATDPSSRRIVYSVLEQGRIQQTRVRRLEDGTETVLPAALFEPRFSRDGRFVAGESSDEAVVVCEIGGSCRPITPTLRLGVTSIGWSADGSRVFYLQRTSQAGWGELKSVGVADGAEQAHGSFGPFRTLEMSVDVSPRDEIVFAPYQESPHELWMARLH